MSYSIIMIYRNITNYALIGLLEKDDSLIEKHHLENIVIFFQRNWKFVLHMVI